MAVRVAQPQAALAPGKFVNGLADFRAVSRGGCGESVEIGYLKIELTGVVAKRNRRAIQQPVPDRPRLQRDAAGQQPVTAGILDDRQAEQLTVEGRGMVDILHHKQAGLQPRRCGRPASAGFKAAAVAFAVFGVEGKIVQRRAGEIRAETAVGQAAALGTGFERTFAPERPPLAGTAGAMVGFAPGAGITAEATAGLNHGRVPP